METAAQGELTELLERRPEARRLLKRKESPLRQPGEMALKGYSHWAPGGGPALLISSWAVAERRREGMDHMTRSLLHPQLGPLTSKHHLWLNPEDLKPGSVL